MKLWEANSVLFFLPTIWWLDALKRREEITLDNTFEQKKKKPGLKFNPGLALILSANRPSNNWAQIVGVLSRKINQSESTLADWFGSSAT